MTTEHKAPETLLNPWQELLLQNADDFRYAVTLTMKQAYQSKKRGTWIVDPLWVYLDSDKARQELTHFRNRLSDAVYGKNWHRRARGRKPAGIYFIAGTHGQSEGGLGAYWDSATANSASDVELIDADGVISTVSKKPRRHRLQNIHYHCFIDKDLGCRWDNDSKSMVEALDISEITALVKRLWNQQAFGAEIEKIDVQDIYTTDGKHKGWANYIEGKMCDADGYDIHNTVIRKDTK